MEYGQGIEIERKFLIKHLPEDIDNYPFHIIEQGYLNTSPTVRIRREDDYYYMTYKSKGTDDGLSRTEYNLPLTQEAYEHLSTKVDGNIIRKKRYLIPYANHTIELDIFETPFAPLILAEVEFKSEVAAHDFAPPAWFDKDVTGNREYYNSTMSMKQFD